MATQLQAVVGPLKPPLMHPVSRSTDPGLVGLPVLLHIYDVSHEFGIQHLNTATSLAQEFGNPDAICPRAHPTLEQSSVQERRNGSSMFWWA